MTAKQSHPPAAGARSRSEAAWQGEGFGLVLCGSYPVIGLAGRQGGAGADATRLLLEDPGVAPPTAGGERLREFRHADGRVGLAIDDHGEAGLAILAEEFGSHRISRDGKTIRSRPAVGLPAWRWQRLLTGQVLPLAAALRGLEVLHASAVALGGVAFALAGDSGAGKSSLAAHLVLRGNALLADDVLAVSLDAAGRPRAHPGSTALSFRGEDAQLAEALTSSALATATGTDDKQHLLCPPTAQLMPLGAVYRLRRGSADAAPIGEARTPTLADLMGCSYVKYLSTPSRLTAQLSVQSGIARNCSIVPVNVGAGLTAEMLAKELERHMRVTANRLNA
jgi:hypothetical protein